MRGELTGEIVAMRMQGLCRPCEGRESAWMRMKVNELTDLFLLLFQCESLGYEWKSMLTATKIQYTTRTHRYRLMRQISTRPHWITVVASSFED